MNYTLNYQRIPKYTDVGYRRKDTFLEKGCTNLGAYELCLHSGLNIRSTYKEYIEYPYKDIKSDYNKIE